MSQVYSDIIDRALGVRCDLQVKMELYSNPASAPCRTVLLAVRQFDVSVDVKHVDLSKGDHLTPEFIQMNPQHTIPTLVDNGLVMTESRAIVQYLANKYAEDDSLYPNDAQKRAKIDMRLLFDVITLYHRFGDAYYPMLFQKVPLDPEKVAKLEEALEYAELYLSEGFIAGSELSIADFSVVASLTTIAACRDISNYGNINEYLDKCRGLLKGWEENQEGADMFGEWHKGIAAEVEAQQNPG